MNLPIYDISLMNEALSAVFRYQTSTSHFITLLCLQKLSTSATQNPLTSLDNISTPKCVVSYSYQT